MQQPHDTRQFPAYDPYADDHAASQPTEAFAAAGREPAPREPAPRRGFGTGTLLALGAAAVVLVAVVGLIGLELGMRNSIGDRLEREATSALGSPAQVELGARPVVLSVLDDTLGSVRITTDGTPAEGTTGPAPVVDLTAEGVRTEGELAHVRALSGTVFVSDAAMTAAAAEQTGGGDSLLSGLLQVQSVTSDPASGTLRVALGMAEAQVTPRLVGRHLQLEPEQATVLGFPLPAGLLGGTVSMMDSTLAELPDGVDITGVRVVDGGMTLDVNGTDVVLEQQHR